MKLSDIKKSLKDFFFKKEEYTKAFVIIATLCSLIILIPVLLWGEKYLWLWMLIAYVTQYFLLKKFNS